MSSLDGAADSVLKCDESLFTHKVAPHDKESIDF
jgi:hypothetical protein